MDPWRIMAIDDDADVLGVIEETLNKKYKVLTVQQSSDAVRVMELFEPDLIILDVLMPEVSGFQLIEYIKTHKDLSYIPVIFLSAKSGRDDLRDGYAKGAQLFLPKPLLPERLLKNVDLIFDQTPPPRTQKKLSLSEAKARMDFMATTDLSGIRHSDRVGRSGAGQTPALEEEKEDEEEKRTWLG